MADPVVAERHALTGVELPAARPGVRVADAGRLTRFVVRGPALHGAGDLGLVLPTAPCRAASAGGRHALWLGPDEWLVLAPATEKAALTGALTRLASATGGIAVDVGDRNAGLVIEGPAAADVLSAGCPLDLDPTAYPVGMCTRTLFAKAEIVLWRRDTETFHIEVWRSFAPYVVGLLREAMQDLA